MNRRCLVFAIYAVAASAQVALGQYDGGRAVRAAYRQSAPPSLSLEDMGARRSGPVVYQGEPDPHMTNHAGGYPDEGQYMDGGPMHGPMPGGPGCANGNCADGS